MMSIEPAIYSLLSSVLTIYYIPHFLFRKKIDGTQLSVVASPVHDTGDTLLSHCHTPLPHSTDTQTIDTHTPLPHSTDTQAM